MPVTKKKILIHVIQNLFAVHSGSIDVHEKHLPYFVLRVCLPDLDFECGNAIRVIFWKHR